MADSVIKSLRVANRAVVWTVTASIVLMLSLLAERALYQWTHSAAEARSQQAQRLSAEINLLDEQLTNAALMAAYSADPRWTSRYDAALPKIYAAIEAATRRFAYS
jgi:hypothetical protein